MKRNKYKIISIVGIMAAILLLALDSALDYMIWVVAVLYMVMPISKGFLSDGIQ